MLAKFEVRQVVNSAEAYSSIKYAEITLINILYLHFHEKSKYSNRTVTEHLIQQSHMDNLRVL